MDNKKIGQFLAKRRKTLALTQQQLADQIGVSNKAISKWETGEGYPDITSIPELCAALHISTDDFFAGEVKVTPKANYVVLDRKSRDFSSGAHIKQRVQEFENGLKKGFKGPGLYLLTFFSSYCIATFFYFRGMSIETEAYVLIYGMPFVCLICGLHHGVKNPFSILFPATVGLLFWPFAAVINLRLTHTLMLMLIYSAVTLIGSIPMAIAKSYTFSVKKKDRATTVSSFREPPMTEHPVLEGSAN